VFDGQVMGFIELIMCLINFRSMWTTDTTELQITCDTYVCVCVCVCVNFETHCCESV